MNDTHPIISKRVKKMMKKKTGEERLLMGFSMMKMARLLAISSIKANSKKHLKPNELRKKIFLRFYSNDFSPEMKEKIYGSL